MKVRAGRCLLTYRLKEANITQIELAEKLRMPRSQISEYANNRRIMALHTAKSISNVLGIHVDDLYEWIPDSK